MWRFKGFYLNRIKFGIPEFLENGFYKFFFLPNTPVNIGFDYDSSYSFNFSVCKFF